ncbi:MAG: membrane protein insertase YidC [Candidatus Latescibacteria bacterium]|nr:membrane protein insertase YidC [Candidatus Latescibacterota bacterium]
MDRRTVLAFALIGLILVLMPYYMRWIYGDSYEESQFVTDDVQTLPPDIPSSQNRQTDPTRSSELKAAPQIDNTASSSDQTLPVANLSFEPKDIVVDTERFQATISTKGGLITSWKLKTYLTRSGEWLELISDGGHGLGTSIQDFSLDNLEFRTSDTRLELLGDRQEELVLRANSSHGVVEKRMRFQGNRYHIQLSVSVDNLPRDADLSVQWKGSLADTEETAGEAGGFYATNYEQVVTYAGGEVEIWDFDRIQDVEEPPSGQITWVGIRNKYFLSALIPSEGRYVLKLDAESVTTPLGSTHPNFNVDLVSDNPENVMNLDLYIGPISYTDLRSQNESLDGNVRELDLDEFVDYGPSFLRTILKPVTILIVQLFLAIHQLVPNYGVVIILFSLIVKIVVFPLTHKSLESAAKMQQLQPKIAELKEKIKDSQKMNQAMMKLYKEEKINPLGGCLPMVLQMPILFSLFSLFRGTIELRHADFVWWITDLSQPDTLMIAGFGLHVLPLLMGISMFIQQKMTMKDPKQAALVYIMPVFLTYIFWTMSSGLVFYYTLYNVSTLAQQIIMERTKTLLAAK